MASNDTQQFVEIESFHESMVRLKNGTFRSILEVSSMNFELKSADEKTAIILRFQDLLNSLDFPLQIMIKSRELNLTGYLQQIEALSQSINNELLKIQLVEYKRFISGLTELSNIMTKKFYAIIPVFPNIIADKRRLFGGKKGNAQQINEEELGKYSVLMQQRVDLLFNLLSGIGLAARTLEKNELANIFYSFYNPENKETIQIED